MKLDELLRIEPMYQDKRGKERNIQVFYKCGRYAEKEKNLTMINDIQSTSEYILELIIDKESLEEQLAAFGSIHYIYVRVLLFIYFLQKTFKEVQEDIKLDIKKYLREKN